MNKDHLITIVIFTYNREMYLPRAVESIRNQSYKDYTILIIDNASTDNTEAICSEYVEKDSRIQYVRNEKNMGIPYSFDKAISITKTKYISFLDDDDIYDKMYIEKSVTLLEEDSKEEYSCVSPHTIVIERETGIPQKIAGEVNLEYDNAVDRICEYFVNSPLSHIVTGVFRRSVFDILYKLDSAYNIPRYCSDLIVLVKFIVIGKCAVLRDTCIYKADRGNTYCSTTLPFEIFNCTVDFPLEEYYLFHRDAYINSLKEDAFYDVYLTKNEKEYLIDFFKYYTIAKKEGNFKNWRTIREVLKLLKKRAFRGNSFLDKIHKIKYSFFIKIKLCTLKLKGVDILDKH